MKLTTCSLDEFTFLWVVGGGLEGPERNTEGSSDLIQSLNESVPDTPAPRLVNIGMEDYTKPKKLPSNLELIGSDQNDVTHGVSRCSCISLTACCSDWIAFEISLSSRSKCFCSFPRVGYGLGM